MRADRNHSGFTLIELLVSMTVLTIMVGIVYSSFVSVTDTSELARSSAEEWRYRQYLWRSLSQNLTAVYSDPACENPAYEFLGENVDGPYGPADTMRFCTSLPMSGANSLPGVLKVVTYAVSEEMGFEGEYSEDEVRIDETLEDEKLSVDLLITEEPLILSEDTFAEDGDEMEMADFETDEEMIEQARRESTVPIGTMDVLYYDGTVDEWLEDWDSVAEGRMPWAVRVKINFPRTEAELAEDQAAGIDLGEEPDLDMTIALPTGAGVVERFFDLNHYRHSEMAGDIQDIQNLDALQDGLPPEAYDEDDSDLDRDGNRSSSRTSSFM